MKTCLILGVGFTFSYYEFVDGSFRKFIVLPTRSEEYNHNSKRACYICLSPKDFTANDPSTFSERCPFQTPPKRKKGFEPSFLSEFTYCWTDVLNFVVEWSSAVATEFKMAGS